MATYPNPPIVYMAMQSPKPIVVHVNVGCVVPPETRVLIRNGGIVVIEVASTPLATFRIGTAKD